MEIETKDVSLKNQLLRKRDAKRGDEINIGNASIRYEGMTIREGLDLPLIFNFSIEIGKLIVADVIARWILENLEGKQAKLRMERKEVQLEQGQITKVLEEKMVKYS
jgi:hypothetical protein